MIDGIPLNRAAGTYTAMSYFAGSPEDTSIILLDGRPFNVFSTLANAISDLLNNWKLKNSDQILYVWADQICINQSDYEERSRQVALMRDIYRRSRDTVVWLPCTRLRMNVTTERTALFSVLSWLPGTSPGEKAQPRRIDREAISNHVHNLLETPFELMQWLKKADEFVARRWWGRSWVYQEFIMSTRPIFLSGKISATWLDLQPWLSFIRHELQPLLRKSLSQPEIRACWQAADEEIDGHSKKWRQWNEKQKDLNRKLANIDTKLKSAQRIFRILRFYYLWRQKKMAELQKQHTQRNLQRLPWPAIIGGLAHNLDLVAMSSMLEGRNRFHQDQKLTTVLRHSRNCQSSDP